MSEIKQIHWKNQEFSKADFLDVLEENPFPALQASIDFLHFLTCGPFLHLQSEQRRIIKCVSHSESHFSFLRLHRSHLDNSG